MDAETMTDADMQQRGEGAVVMHPDPPVDAEAREAWKFVSIVRDGMMAAMGLILCWAVWSLHTTAVEVAEIKANRFTIQDSVTLKDSVAMALDAQNARQDAKVEKLRTILEQIATDTAEIKGRLGHADDRRPVQGH